MPPDLRTLFVVALAFAAAGCQLVTDTAGLTDGDEEAGAAVDATAPVSDASDASTVVGDAGADARADAHATPVDAGAPADTGPVVPPAIGEDGGALPGPPSSTCSVDSTVPATIVIANQSTITIEIWWVDYTCVEHDYGNIDPGGSTTLGTYVTHPWRIRADGTHALLRDVPPSTDPLPRTVTYP